MMTKVSKRLSALLCATALVFSSAFFAFAESDYKLIDDALLFFNTESEDIDSQLEDLSQTTGWDVIIYTNHNDIESYDMEDFCNDYYDKNGFGKGSEYSGIMLTIDMSSREMYILTRGDTMYYFNDDRVDEILDDVQYYLSEDEYYDAAQAFIDDTYNFYNEGKTTEGSTSNIKISFSSDVFSLVDKLGLICLVAVVSLIIALITVFVVNHSYKNNGKEDTYNLSNNSTTKLTDKQDIFLHKSVSVRTVSNSSSSGRSGGGRSSSHGGGGRSF